MLKVVLWSNFHFFYIFIHNRSSLDILPNFSLLQTLITTRGFWLTSIFPKINGHHQFSLLQGLAENLGKCCMVWNYNNNVEVCAKRGAKVLYAKCRPNFYFNPWGALKKMTSFKVRKCKNNRYRQYREFDFIQLALLQIIGALVLVLIPVSAAWSD